MSKPIQPIICMNVPNASIAHLLPSIKPCGVIISVKKKTALKHPKACPVKRDRFRRFQVCFRKRNRPLVFLNECGVRKDWIRRYGYAPIGQPCYSEHDWHGKNQVNAIGIAAPDKRQFIGGQRLNPNTLWQRYSEGKQSTAQLAARYGGASAAPRSAAADRRAAGTFHPGD